MTKFLRSWQFYELRQSTQFGTTAARTGAKSEFCYNRLNNSTKTQGVGPFPGTSHLKELKELYGELWCGLIQNRHLTEDGFDEVAFYLSANPGEPLRPLVKVASGENYPSFVVALKRLSPPRTRIMILSSTRWIQACQRSGGQAIAEKIANRQKLPSSVITHLPQCLAMADYQCEIEKSGPWPYPYKVKQRHTRKTRSMKSLGYCRLEVTPLTIEHARALEYGGTSAESIKKLFCLHTKTAFCV